MFIEDLWEKYPEQTINAIKKIFEVREERGDKLVFLGQKNGLLVFEKYGHCPDSIKLSDFQVAGHGEDSVRKREWIKFMYSIYGTSYILQFISSANKDFDRSQKRRAEMHEEKIKKVLDYIGFEISESHTR